MILHFHRKQRFLCSTYLKLNFKTPCANDTIFYETQTPTTPSQFSMEVTVETPGANVLYGDSQRGVAQRVVLTKKM